MIDLDDNRLEVAKSFGATELINSSDGKAANGKTVADVARVDPGYLEWMLAQKEQSDPEVEEDWIYTLRYHLGKLQ